MPVTVASRVTGGEGWTRGLAAQARAVLAIVGRTRDELSLSLVDDAEIRTLNRRWRGRDRPTDVLAFALQEGPAAPAAARALLGDVVISLDTARRQARTARRALARRLEELLVHGILHLLGYDHEVSLAEDHRMRRRAREVHAALRARAARGRSGAGSHGGSARRRPSR